MIISVAPLSNFVFAGKNSAKNLKLTQGFKDILGDHIKMSL